jgi:hypothetical protein
VLISTRRTGALALRVAAAAAATSLLRLVCLDALELFPQAPCFFCCQDNKPSTPKGDSHSNPSATDPCRQPHHHHRHHVAPHRPHSYFSLPQRHLWFHPLIAIYISPPTNSTTLTISACMLRRLPTSYRLQSVNCVQFDRSRIHSQQPNSPPPSSLSSLPASGAPAGGAGCDLGETDWGNETAKALRDAGFKIVNFGSTGMIYVGQVTGSDMPDGHGYMYQPNGDL